MYLKVWISQLRCRALYCIQEDLTFSDQVVAQYLCQATKNLVVILQKCFFKKLIFKILFTFRTISHLADRHKLEIKNQLILTVWHRMELSIEIFAVDLKCLKDSL